MWDNDFISTCKECYMNNEDNEGFACYKCGGCLNKAHCHDSVDGSCIQYIKDCWEHHLHCQDGCHDECACQERG